MTEATRNRIATLKRRLDCALDPKTGDLIRDLQISLGQLAVVNQDLPELLQALRLELDDKERAALKAAEATS